MHDLGEEMIRFAEVRQKRLVAVLSGVPGDGTADQVKAEALGAVVGVQLDLPTVHPLALGLMRLLHPDEALVCALKQLIRPLLPVAVDDISNEFHSVHGSALDGKQRLAVQPMTAGLIEGENREPVQHILCHHIFAQIGHILQKGKIIFLRFLEDGLGLMGIDLPAILANTHKDNNEIPLRAREVLPGNRKDFSNYWNLLFYSHGSLSSGMRRCHRCDFTTFPIRRKPIYLGIEILLDQHNRGNCEVHEEPHKS